MSIYIGLCEQYDDGYRMAESPIISVRFRNKDGERVDRRIEWEPCIYINPNNVAEKQQWDGDRRQWVDYHTPKRITTSRLVENLDRMKSKDGQPVVRRIERDCDVTDVHGNKLWCIVLGSPSHIWMVKRKFTPVFMTTTRAAEQYCAYNDMEALFEEATDDPRILMFDLEECLYRGKDNIPFQCDNPDNEMDRREISLIGVHEMWTGEKHQWAYHPNLTANEVKEVGHGYKGTLKYFDSERVMLLSFLNYFNETDPDIVTAWGLGYHDLAVLYWRCKSLGVPVGQFSPFGIWEAPQKGHNNYSWTEQPIRGVNCVDMKHAFERYWHATRSEKLLSGRLKEVSNMPIFSDVAGKLDWDVEDFWDPDYDQYIDEYCEYNLKDVDVMATIEDRCGVIALQVRLQALLRAPWDSCFYGSRMAQVLFNREADFRMPDDDISLNSLLDDEQGEEDASFEGAFIVHPIEELTAGLHYNVAFLDYAAMYPNIIISSNTSWDTIYPDGEIEGYGCRFTNRFEGILPRIVRSMMDMRADYKRLAREAKDAGDERAYSKYDNSQVAVKVVTNTFYGLTGNTGKGKVARREGRTRKHPWADERIAATITMYGRDAIQSIREKCLDMGYETIYGHTDSAAVKMGDDKSIEQCVEEGKALAETLTEFIQDRFKSERMVLEFETFLDRLLLVKKNNYAGRKAWDIKFETETMTGFDIQKEPFKNRMKVQGAGFRAVNAANVGRTIQQEVLEMIFDGAPKAQVVDFLSKKYHEVVDGKVEIVDLQARGKIRKHLPHPYDCRCGECPYIPNMGERPGIDYNHDRESYKFHGGRGGRLWDQYVNGMEPWRILTFQPATAYWHNEYLADTKYLPIEKDDNFWWLYVNKTPTPVPVVGITLPKKRMADNRGYSGVVGYRDWEQLEGKGYTIDYEACAERHVLNLIRTVMEGMVFSYDSTLKDRCFSIDVPPKADDKEVWKTAIKQRERVIRASADDVLDEIRGRMKVSLSDFLVS